jgi:peptidyl-dipeptidase Dcp
MKRIALFLLSIGVAAAGCAHGSAAPAADEETMKTTAATDNPLLAPFETPFGAPPFDRIEPAHFRPAFAAAIAAHEEEIAAIAGAEQEPDFDNTIAALDRSGALLDRVARVFFGLNAAETNDALDAIAKEVAPRLSAHSDAIFQNEALFARIKAVYEKRDALELDAEQSTLLDKTHRDFVRGGAELEAGQKAELSRINEELAGLKVQFGQNVLAENNAFALIIEHEAELAGLPERVIEAAAKAAAERGHEGEWAFTLHKPSLIPFLRYSERRPLREKLFKAYISRGANGDERDNRDIVKRIVELRIRKAELLGHPNYASFALAERMAKTPEAVYTKLRRIWQAALPVAEREAAALQELIESEGGDFALQPWDWWYYAERRRRAQYDLDESALRPYFELERVLQGAFEVASRLYGLRFVPRDDVPVYHPEVRAFEVQEQDGSRVGLLYVDYFPRPGKRGGAWCGTYRQQIRLDGRRVAPVVTNVGNFTRPGDDSPSLLSFEEVTTLFHEFGHALHMLLADTTYAATGEDVKVDFVELPSQIMENWASEPEVLALYAKHHETGEPIPAELVDKLERSRHFNQGFATVEYLAASFLDMDWHTLESAAGIDVAAFEQRSMEAIGLIPQIVVRYKSPYFRHIFASDFYAAGYYSYIWAAVLDADAFEAFRQAGLFDRETASAFREHILEPGGSQDPMVLYKRFRGAEPKIEPLLERRGLLPAED